MNPLILFDYVYYSIAYLYANKWGYEQQKEFIGIIFISLIQFFNVFAIFGFIRKPLFELIEINPLVITFLGSLVFIIINTIRYKKVVTYTELSEKWDKEGERIIIFKKAGVILYVILTLIMATFSSSIN